MLCLELHVSKMCESVIGSISDNDIGFLEIAPVPIKVFYFNSYRIKFFKQDKQGQNCKASGKRFKC